MIPLSHAVLLAALATWAAATPKAQAPSTTPAVTASAPVAANSEDAAESLAAAERAFSRMSVEHGMRDAFLAYLGDDAVVFNPRPAKGREVWEAKKPNPATLIWEPSFAAVSAAGDLGYDTGPWEFHGAPGAKDTTVYHGHFISVWGRPTPKDPWKVVLDVGIDHEKPALGVGSGAFEHGAQPGAAPAADVSRSALKSALAAEAAFAADARRRGPQKALARCAAADLRFNHPGHPPAVGWESAAPLMAADTLPTTFETSSGRASRSGDLAFTYGFRMTQNAAAPDSSVFVHIWRATGGKWKVAMVVENPLK